MDIVTWLNQHQEVSTGIWGFLGSLIRVSLIMGSEAPLTRWHIIATMLAGTCFAVFSPEFIGTFVMLPQGAAGLAGLFGGLLGMNLAENIIKAEIPNPWKKQ